MADKTGYIGRNPGDSSVTIARQTFTPTSDTTDFTFTAGYTVGLCDVYLNGAKLIDATDYDANTGTTVGLTSAATNGDVVEIVAYKAFNLGAVAEATGNFTVGSQLSVGSTSTLTGVVTTGGDLYVGGVIYGDGSNLTGVAATDNINTNNIAISGIATVGTSITMRESAINVTGVITATSFSGDGSGLTGISGFGTAIDSSAGTLGNLIYKTPRSYHAVGVTSTYIVAGETSGKMAFTRLAEIRLGTASTMHIAAGTTLVMNVLNLF